jgi:hypothetical protein
VAHDKRVRLIGGIWRWLRWVFAALGTLATIIGFVDLPDQLAKWSQLAAALSLDQQTVRTVFVVVGVLLIAAALIVRAPRRADVTFRPGDERDTERAIDALHIDSGSSGPAAVEIGLADPPDEGVEGYLEWPHLSVRNTSQARLLAVGADLLITGRQGASGTILKLRFDPDDEGSIVLEPRETRTIPLCLRAREPNRSFTTSRRRIAIPLVPWEVYVTDEGFLLNGTTGIRLPQGDWDLRVRITYGQVGSAEAWFRAFVPRVVGKPVWIVPLPATRGQT